MPAPARAIFIQSGQPPAVGGTTGATGVGAGAPPPDGLLGLVGLVGLDGPDGLVGAGFGFGFGVGFGRGFGFGFGFGSGFAMLV